LPGAGLRVAVLTGANGLTMTDVTAGDAGAKPAAGAAGGFDLSAVGRMMRRGDIALAIGVMMILTILIVPLPPFLLDVFLAASIILSVLILMVALFIAAPLEFTIFPTVLLIATMLRLALNLASTRLILQNGHTGTGAAGHVIEAFGQFVMGGNFVIGIIVFAILVIVNFIVITKGSGRIAEVAARFTLDAMPGKQMAIDADLNAGLIDQEGAKARRKALEDEASFFGAMDGASKFVRGDAIAGLLITFINVIGGIIIGVMQQNMSFGDAGRVYTILTVGDGLVSQIPALIVSTAAGLLVSKSGVSGQASKVLTKQLAAYPKALGMAAAVMFVMGILPGMPLIPFWGFAALAGYLAFTVSKQQDRADAEQILEAAKAVADEGKIDEPVTASLKMDELKIEIGYALLPLVNGENGQDRLTEQIKALRKQLAGDMGFVMPSVRILDNVQLEANAYVVRIKEVEAGSGQVFPNSVMAMDPMGGQVQLPGQHLTEPTFGLPATWIDQGMREEAQLRGYTVVDAATVISTHLTEIIKTNTADLLSYVEVQKLLRELPKEHQELLKEISPSQISTTGIQRVLQLLLAERISIRDLGAILEAISEVAGVVRDPRLITEHVRSRLGRQICAQNVAPQGHLPMITLSPQWEDAFATSLVGDGEQKHLAMQPSKLQEFVLRLREVFDQAAREGEMPVLVTSSMVRLHVRAVVERFRPQTAVMAQGEIHPRARLKALAAI
jgi:flagellar biosynthesis protein FlhA